MSALSINSLMESFAKPELTTAVTKSIIDRHHFTGPSRNSYKRHEYHEYDGHYYGHGGHKGGKRSIALSALTLLSFLFFLHILQSCLQEHMDSMNNTGSTQIIIMQARLQAARRAAAQKRKAELAEAEDIKPFYTNTTLLKEPRVGGNIDKYRAVSQIPVKLKIIDRNHRP